MEYHWNISWALLRCTAACPSPLLEEQGFCFPLRGSGVAPKRSFFMEIFKNYIQKDVVQVTDSIKIVHT